MKAVHLSIASLLIAGTLAPAAFAAPSLDGSQIACSSMGGMGFTATLAQGVLSSLEISQVRYAVQYGAVTTWARSLGILGGMVGVDGVSFDLNSDGPSTAEAHFQMPDGSQKTISLSEVQVSIADETDPGENGSGPYPAKQLVLVVGGQAVVDFSVPTEGCQ